MLNHFRGAVTGLGHRRCKPATDFHCGVSHRNPRFSFPARCVKECCCNLAKGSQVRLGPLYNWDRKDQRQVWWEGWVEMRNPQKQRSQLKAGVQWRLRQEGAGGTVRPHGPVKSRTKAGVTRAGDSLGWWLGWKTQQGTVWHAACRVHGIQPSSNLTSPCQPVMRSGSGSISFKRSSQRCKARMYPQHDCRSWRTLVNACEELLMQHG